MDVLCLDYNAGEDLMLPDRLGRYLAAVDDRPPSLVLLGSGEDVERQLTQRGGSPQRHAGELRITDSDGAAYEAAMRTELHGFVGRLTDAGVSAVGFSGFDRPLFRIKEGSLVFDGVQWGDDWVASGVVPVLSSACLSASGKMLDIHPVRTGPALVRSVAESRLVILHRIPKTHADIEKSGLTSRHLIDQMGLPEDAAMALDELKSGAVLEWHVDDPGRRGPSPVRLLK